jgi:hypothetical protein
MALSRVGRRGDECGDNLCLEPGGYLPARTAQVAGDVESRKCIFSIQYVKKKLACQYPCPPCSRCADAALRPSHVISGRDATTVADSVLALGLDLKHGLVGLGQHGLDVRGILRIGRYAETGLQVDAVMDSRQIARR